MLSSIILISGNVKILFTSFAIKSTGTIYVTIFYTETDLRIEIIVKQQIVNYSWSRAVYELTTTGAICTVNI